MPDTIPLLGAASSGRVLLCPEWAVIQSRMAPVFQWRSTDGATAYPAWTGIPTACSQFNPTVLATSGTTWKIVRWNEVGGF
jgi:hypothetical protein